jgi:hypothetical protein
MVVGEWVRNAFGAMRDRSVVISRRQLLRNATIIAAGATVLAKAVTATRSEADEVANEIEPGKLTKAVASYRTTPYKGQRCGECMYYKNPSSCSLVSGTISVAGWCKFYAKKS